MNILQRMLMRAFLPVFAAAAAFFVLILLLVDLYPKLSAFAANEVSVAQIAGIAALYAPTAARFAVPIGLLFAITYTLGTIQARNELIAVLGAGVGLRSFMSPLLLVGLIASPGLLAFDEGIGTPALRAYNERYRAAVGHSLFLNNTDVTVLDGGGRRVYRADYYNDREGALRGLTVVERTADGRLVSRTDAARAEWMDDRWMLYDVRHYRWDAAGERLIQESIAESSDHYAPGPDTFRQESRDVADMTLREGWTWVRTLRRAGLPYRSAQTDLYAKAGFAVTPFVVSVIAAAVGGMLRRNVLLASMLIALIGSVGYFVLQMVAHILAKTDVIPPLLGASLSAVVFLVLGTVMLWRART
ncbi:MAG: LptF/LptG family permease [Spirochaetaceae bacterium]|nr:LptF/LptG family permease [Spirochaetaceae bacterium]